MRRRRKLPAIPRPGTPAPPKISEDLPPTPTPDPLTPDPPGDNEKPPLTPGDEDQELKNELDEIIERLKGYNAEEYLPSLEDLRRIIQSATTSLTSVPKPLKFLKCHYMTLKALYERNHDQEVKQKLAIVVSVLAIIMDSPKDSLNYRLRSECLSDLTEWGHEYVRHLTTEITNAWPNTGRFFHMKLLELVDVITPYFLNHNSEVEACDLLMEIDSLHLMEKFVDENTYPKVCEYLKDSSYFVLEEEREDVLKTIIMLGQKFKRHAEAMRAALALNDFGLIEKIFQDCPDVGVKRQMAFMLARQNITIDLASDDEDSEELIEIMSNTRLNSYFLNFVRQLDITEAKVPEDVYKSHLERTRNIFGAPNVESARNNMANCLVNGLLNTGFGTDRVYATDKNHYIHRNKEQGMICAVGSLGLIMMWDVFNGLAVIDRYLYSEENNIRAGALLACGIINSSIRSDIDPAHALLSDYVQNSSHSIRLSAILGLGIAYAGTDHAITIETLKSVFDAEQKKIANIEALGITALSLGLISVGSMNPKVTEILLQWLLASGDLELGDMYTRYIFLGLALIYMGRLQEADKIICSLEALDEPFRSTAITFVEICAYAGSGNVLKIQHLLHICAQHCPITSSKREFVPPRDLEEESPEEPPIRTSSLSSGAGQPPAAESSGQPPRSSSPEFKLRDYSTLQAIAALGIAIIAIGEETGCAMAIRSYGHLMRYTESTIRRVVPLGLALLSVSHAQIRITEMLSKFSHDADTEVAHSAIFAMGVCGAGTNDARLAIMLRNLASYYAKDPNNLFMVRVAQGLVHLGKGTMTLSPFHSDGQILNPVALSALISTMIAFIDVPTIIIFRPQYILFTFVPAIQSRMLITVDEDLQEVHVLVRVGQAVNVVGMAGDRKRITGFQTHTTPVLLAIGERAELATDDYVALTPVLENIVILRKVEKPPN